jgi:hypothetical protein
MKVDDISGLASVACTGARRQRQVLQSQKPSEYHFCHGRGLEDNEKEVTPGSTTIGLLDLDWQSIRQDDFSGRDVGLVRQRFDSCLYRSA